MPQPYLVPVSPAFSLIAHNSGVSGSTSSSNALPLIVSLAIAFPLTGSSIERASGGDAGPKSKIVQIKNARGRFRKCDLPRRSGLLQPEQPRRIAAEDRGFLLVAERGGREHVVDRMLFPRNRMIGPEHDLAGAD